MGCSPRSPSRCGRWDAPTTCRCRRCSATRSPTTRAGRAASYVAATVLVVGTLAALAVALAHDQRIAAIFVAAAGAVLVTLRLVAGAADADRAPPAACALDRAAARDRQHLSAGRAHHQRRAVARPGPRAPGHGDRDRRQSAPAVHGGAAGAGAGVLLPRHSAGGCRALRRMSSARMRRAPRSSACRCCAAASWRRTACRSRRSSRRRAPPGCCRAIAASPMRTRCRPARAWSKGEWWKPDEQGPPLVSFEKRVADGLGLKLGDTVTRQRAGAHHHGAHRQSAHARLAEPRHQFRDGVLARHLPGRAPYRHRHPHLSGRQHPGAGDRAAQGAGRRLPVRHRGAGARRARCGRPCGHQSGARPARRDRPHFGGGAAGAGRGARVRPSEPGARRGGAQGAGRQPRAGC